ncbi:MAG: MFS transporter [Ardenticatenia bacterium]|nr:MFS transporter [Ardenticatenia bacterium]
MHNRRPLLIIFFIIFVNLLGFGIIIPLLPFYADHVGATPFQIGLLFASYSVSQLVAAPVLGSLSDRHGRRPILLVSLLGTVISFALLAVATSLWLLFVARIIDGLSGGNISTARAYISDVTDRKDRAKAFGLIGAAFGLGFIFGPALGGVLGRFNYAAPAWAAAGLAALALIMTWFGLPESHRRRASATSTAPWRDLPQLLTRPTIGTLLLIDFLYWASFAVYQTTFALFGKIRFGFGITEVGYILALAGVIGVIVQGGLVGLITRRFGESRTLAGGLLLAALGLGSAALTHSVAAFVVAVVPAAVGAALSQPALIALISHTASPEEQGRIQGVSGALESLGRTVGPVWGNSMLDLFGEGVAFFSAAVVLAGIALFAVRLVEHTVLPQVQGQG